MNDTIKSCLYTINARIKILEQELNIIVNDIDLPLLIREKKILKKIKKYNELTNMYQTLVNLTTDIKND